MAKDMKFVATLDDRVSKGLDKIGDRLGALNRVLSADGQKLVRQSAAQSEQRVAKAKATTVQIARLEYDLSRAQADAITDRWARLRAIEDANYRLRLVRFRGNNEALELEARRHSAKQEAITAQQGAFPNTPFQQLLAGVKQGVGFQNGVAGLAMTAGTMLGTTVAVTGLTAAMTSAVNKAKEFNTVNRALSFAAGGAREGAQEFQFLREQAARLGLPLLESARGFAQLAAAARGTTLEGKGARDIFKGISEASVSLGLSGEQTAGALNAIQQMISKGTVQSEELRGQLGERIPGAFQIAARAMNMTTAQLGKALEQGQVFADDFLPKFSAELHKTFGDTASSASGEAQQSIQKLKNSLSETASVAGGAFLQAMGAVAKVLTFDATAGMSEENLKATRREMQAFGKDQFIQAALRKKWAEEDRREEILKRAQAQDAIDRRMVKGMQDADIVRSKNLETETKERKKAAENAAKEAKRQAEEMEEFRSRAASNALRRDIQFEKAAADRKRLIADQEYENRIKKQVALRDADRRIRDANIGATGSGIGGSLEEIKARQQDEIAAFNLSEEAKTIGLEMAEQVRAAIRRKYSEETRRLEEANAMAVAATMKSNLQGVARQFKAFAPVYKAFAQFENAVATRAAAIEAYKSGSAIPIIGPIVGPVAAAAAIAYGVSNAAQINSAKFATGTDYAPGGMALVGEQGPEMVYLPRGSQVKTAGETKRMMGPQSITINIHPAPGTTPAQARELGAAAHDGYVARLKEWKQMERDAAEWGVVAA